MGMLSYFKGCLKKTAYPFVSDDIDPKEKDTAEYALQQMQAITWTYFDNRCGTTYEDYNRIDEIRSYMDGRQSSAKYKDIFLGKLSTSQQQVISETQEIVETGIDREAWSDINFEDIYSCAPRYMNKLLGKFEKQKHEISVDAIDEISTFQKQEEKEKIWFKKKYKNQRDAINIALGVEPKEEVLPDSREELDLYEQLGGTKLPYEIAMEKCLGHTLQISDNPELARKIYRDFIAIGKAAAIDRVNVEEQLVYKEYLDVQDLIIEYDTRSNYRESRFGAYPFWMTVTKVIEETGMKEDDIVKFANSSVAGMYGNPQWNNSYLKKTGGTWAFGDWRVPVLYGAWISTNSEYTTKVKTKDKGEISFKERFGKLHDGTSNKRTVVTSPEVVYHAKWIPYSEIVWEYGMMNDIPRDGKRGARLPFHVYWIPGKSIGEQMLLPLDDMQIAHLVYQNNKAKSPPPGGAIDVSALENLTVGSKKMHPLEVIKLYFQQGWYLYSTKKAGKPPGTTPAKPFELLQGGNPIAIKEFADSLTLAFNDLANITGLDPVTLATEGGTAPVGNAKLGVADLNDILAPIYSAYISIEESFCRNAASRIQLICRYNNDKTRGYTSVVGEKGVQAIAEAGKRNHTYYGISIFDKPSLEEKQALLQAIQIALTPGKNGVPGIKPSQYSFLVRQMNIPGGLKAAEQMLRFWEKQKEEKEIEAASRNMEENTQREMQVAQAKDGSAAELDTKQTDNKIRLYIAQALVDGKMEDEGMLRELKGYGAKLFADNIAANTQNAAANQGQQMPAQ